MSIFLKYVKRWRRVDAGTGRATSFMEEDDDDDDDDDDENKYVNWVLRDI